MQIPDTADSVQDSLLAICLFAVFADGEKTDTEREAVRKIAEDLGSDNIADLTRQILMRKLSLETVVAALQTREDRLLAYEMALSVCEACGTVTSEEQEFLNNLRALLSIEKSDSQAVETEVAEVTTQPLAVVPLPAATSAPTIIDLPVAPAVTTSAASPSTSTDLTPPPLPPEANSSAPSQNSSMILKYAILNGALELLPETLATVAIIPLQMKMVYRIGKSHGVELDRSHITEFLTVAGAGLGSQVVEGFARKLMKGLGKKMAGKLAGKAADQITGSAFSFASTYAIGHLAEKYYAGGRRLDTQGLRDTFGTLQTKARELHATYLPQIKERASTLNPASVMSLVTGSQQP